jgi:uncharacterized protein involved in exopolysaccharide biosynthesis
MKESTLQEPILTNQSDEDEIDLRVYWQIFNKYKWRIARLTGLIGLLAFLITFSLEPRYRFTTTLMIEFEQAKVISIEEVYGISSNRDYYQTQLGILSSRKLAEKVTKKLNLMSHPAFHIAPKKSPWWHHWLPNGWFLPDEPPTESFALNSNKPEQSFALNSNEPAKLRFELQQTRTKLRFELQRTCKASL